MSAPRDPETYEIRPELRGKVPIGFVVLVGFVSLFLIGWLALGVPAETIAAATGLPPLLSRTLLAAVVAAALAGLFALIKSNGLSAAATTQRLTVSPQGLVEVTPRWTTQLDWPSLTRADQAVQLKVVSTARSGASALEAGGGSAVRGAANALSSADSVIGFGTLEGAGDPLTATQIRQNLAERPADESGRPEVSIPLELYEQDWRQGRLGGWVRAYRPDLLNG